MASIVHFCTHVSVLYQMKPTIISKQQEVFPLDGGENFDICNYSFFTIFGFRVNVFCTFYIYIYIIV